MISVLGIYVIALESLAVPRTGHWVYDENGIWHSFRAYYVPSRLLGRHLFKQ